MQARFVINVFSQRFLSWIKRALIVSMPALNIDTTLNLVGGKAQVDTCKKKETSSSRQVITDSLTKALNAFPTSGKKIDDKNVM